MKNKFLKWFIRILITSILLILFIMSAFSLGERIMFFSFYSNSEVFEKSPGLWTGYVHQGYTSVDESTRLSCGYMSNGRASRIYILKNASNSEFVELRQQNGELYTGHTGGIAKYDDTVYITGSTGCDIFSYADITDGDGIATQVGEFKTPNDPAYCTIYDGNLYVGSFYREGNYETPDEHRFITPSGDKNKALIAIYSLNKETGLPICDTPEMLFSTTGLVQGMAFIDTERIVLSTSYGLAKSHLLVYNLKEASTGMAKINGQDIALLYLDSSCLVDTIVAPPMAEELIYQDEKICIINESASMKYLFGKLTSGNYIYGYKYK